MIKTFGLTKRYKNTLALNRLDMMIEEGDIYGYIGPNGAGKTTTLKILATLLEPTAGHAEICGYRVGRENRKIRPLIGYMPDFFGVYEDMRVDEYLTFFAAAYRIKGEKRKRIVNDVLELTDLGGKRDAMVESLSRGMQQRLGLARALVHDPKVLILDEPASGLDPRARIEIRALLKELKNMGKTILISSHILSELQELCNKIGIIEKGVLLFSGSIEEVRGQIRKSTAIEVSVKNNNDAALKALETHPLIESAVLENRHISVLLAREAEDHTFIAPYLIEKGFKLEMLIQEEPDLEEVFMRVTKGVVA
ncbi:MAG: ABC transporter ATP-binding protein [Planctomycetota bacterium]|jgi:ABC-2 type transport system ATP-binding protein